MLSNIKDKIVSWWQGELQEETLEEIFVDPPVDRYKYHWSSKIVRVLWFFWKNHWKILLPIIVATAVSLFIHFDSRR